ncbi:NfeD family protein [Leekyejoonella antrihumi]|uniref:NfeD family protein n=1 Tax=Leekyejoonella antrihumi TaxID=1660198 RepID=A0A563DTZ8_9MICO|nr:NfeD family protein [Leekyejoonella antrihumi]TWP33725.1 NfeD family protein [Leekyejoonella antrihumi]
MAAIIWLGAGLLLAAGETLSGDLVLLMIGGGALAAAGASWLGAPVWLAAVVFAVVSILLVVAVRPPIKRRMLSAPQTLTNTDALIGKEAITLGSFGSAGGQVRIGGEVWTARPAGEEDSFQRGERLIVRRIDGATAVVQRGN